MSVIAQSKCKLAGRVKRVRLLRAISESSLVSRQELTEMTGLNKSVVSKLTRQLIEEDVIEEAGRGTSTASGRPTVLLSLKRASNVFIGIDVSEYGTWSMLLNANGEVLHVNEIPTPRWSSAEDFVGYIESLIRKLCEDAQIDGSVAKGICVLVPGEASADGEVELNCTMSDIGTVDLGSRLEDIFAVKVVVANGYLKWALAERAAAGGRADALLVACDRGLSVIPTCLLGTDKDDGKSRTNFAHITYRKNGPKCNCGSSGCVEAHAAGWAIERDAQAAPSALMLDLAGDNPEDITIQTVFDAAARGDMFALSTIRKAGFVLGEALASFIEFYDVYTIIFAGQLFSGRSKLYFDAICDGVKVRIHQERFDCLNLAISRLNAYGPAQTAVRRLVDDLIKGPLMSIMQESI